MTLRDTLFMCARGFESTWRSTISRIESCVCDSIFQYRTERCIEEFCYLVAEAYSRRRKSVDDGISRKIERRTSDGVDGAGLFWVYFFV